MECRSDITAKSLCFECGKEVCECGKGRVMDLQDIFGSEGVVSMA